MFGKAVKLKQIACIFYSLKFIFMNFPHSNAFYFILFFHVTALSLSILLQRIYGFVLTSNGFNLAIYAALLFAGSLPDTLDFF